MYWFLFSSKVWPLERRAVLSSYSLLSYWSEREILICWSTRLCIHLLFLVCALSGDRTHSLGLSGWCSNQLRYLARAVLFLFLYPPFISQCSAPGRSWVTAWILGQCTLHFYPFQVFYKAIRMFFKTQGKGEKERNIDSLFHLSMPSLVESCKCTNQGLNPQLQHTELTLHQLC